MNINDMRKQKLAEIEVNARQRAVDEILKLKAKYQNAKDRTYTFEHDGKQVQAVFVTASMSQTAKDPASRYQIELIALPSVVIEGQCHITDSQGRRVGAGCKTSKGERENRVRIDTIAMP